MSFMTGVVHTTDVWLMLVPGATECDPLSAAVSVTPPARLNSFVFRAAKATGCLCDSESHVRAERRITAPMDSSSASANNLAASEGCRVDGYTT